MRDMERQKREQGAMAESRRLVETQISYDDAADTATHQSAGGSPQVFTRDDYYDMISDFSKELTGRRGTYFRPDDLDACLLYTSPSPRDRTRSRMPSSA